LNQIQLPSENSQMQESSSGPAAELEEISMNLDSTKFADLWLYYVNHPVNSIQGAGWQHTKSISLTQGDISAINFRADNDYVWQNRNFNKDEILLSYIYSLTTDVYGLSNRLLEDGSFGVESIFFLGKMWSRDLSDSILEITYLAEQLGLDFLRSARILAVGAAYGRLPLRLRSKFPDAQISCTDGIAFSSMISEAYIRHLGADDRIRVLTLPEIDEQSAQYDLAINIHSFSEMSLESVEWWIKYLVRSNVKFLFIVPNRNGPALNNGQSLLPILNENGFRLVNERNKYSVPAVAQHVPYPSTYYLFINVNHAPN